MKILPITNTYKQKVYSPIFKNHSSYFVDEMDSYSSTTTPKDILLSSVLVMVLVFLFSYVNEKGPHILKKI